MRPRPATGASRLDRPSAGGGCQLLCRLAPPPSRCSRPLPSLTRSPTASTGGAGAAWSSASRRRHVARRGAGARRSSVPARRRRERPRPDRRVPGGLAERRFVRVDRLDDEARARDRAQRRFAAAIGSPVLTIHLFVPHDARGVPRPRRARRGGGRGVPELLRAGLRGRGRDAPDRERAARCCACAPAASTSPVGGHWRDLRAWRERVPELRLHDRHLARGAVRVLRRRVPVAVRARRATRSSSSSATSRSSGAEARSRTSRTRTACSARGCPTAPASSTSTPWSRGWARSCPTSSPRSTSPTRRAREDMKAGYRAVERALEAPRLRALPRRSQPAPGRPVRLAGRRRPPRPGARRCSSCRSASAAGAC